MQDTTAWRSSIWSNTSATSFSDSASPRTTLAIIFSISVLQGKNVSAAAQQRPHRPLDTMLMVYMAMAPVFDSHLRVSDRCSMKTQLPMSTSFLVTKRAVPPPPATKMLALSGSICLSVLARTAQVLLPRRCSLQSNQG